MEYFINIHDLEPRSAAPRHATCIDYVKNNYFLQSAAHV